MSNTVKGQLDYMVYVKCPNCGESFDILAEDDVDTDNEISGPLFSNKWSESKSNTRCPECEHEFEMHGIEY